MLTVCGPSMDRAWKALRGRSKEDRSKADIVDDIFRSGDHLRYSYSVKCSEVSVKVLLAFLDTFLSFAIFVGVFVRFGLKIGRSFS